MARTAVFATAVAGAMLVGALPLASATDVTSTPQNSTDFMPSAVQANMMAMNMCGERDRLVGELEQHFNETVTAIGVVDERAVVEVFVSDSGSWTIVATGTDGLSCILSAGEGWESTTMIRGVDA